MEEIDADILERGRESRDVEKVSTGRAVTF